MENLVYIYNDANLKYPESNVNEEYAFSPSKHYPEYRFTTYSSIENKVYEAVRNVFYFMGYDRDNYGKSTWNPLGDGIISKGDTVLIKPNMVKHENEIIENGTECLYTHPSIVRAIVDFCIIALNGTGRIVIADAPVQSCDFDVFYEKSGYKDIINFYDSLGISIEFYDLRAVVATRKDGLVLQKENPRGEYGSTCIDLASNSDFAELDKKSLKKLRITNYDPRVLNSHHNVMKHEYSVSNMVLESDVIINVPKIKTHRKAGMTGAMKNLVGINANKDYLPHHREGDISHGGDQYEKENWISSVNNVFYDLENISIGKNKIEQAKLYHFCTRAMSKILRMVDPGRVVEGNWCRNDTIWRMVNDLNKIVFYANKSGAITNVTQRKMLVLCDMIVAGEKEGPLRPSPIETNTIICGENPILCDMCALKLMGYELAEIPIVSKSFMYKETLKSTRVFSNSEKWNSCIIDNLLPVKPFSRPDGWK